MISPMPFCPSFEPWAKRDTGAGEDQDAADPPGRRLIALRRLIEGRIADDELQSEEQQAAATKPMIGDSSSA